MFRCLPFGFLVCSSIGLYSCANLPAANLKEHVLISGKVSVDNNPERASQIEVFVDGASFPVALNGSFEVSIPPKQFYQFRFSADNAYDAVHTFSSSELEIAEGQLLVPPVSLVEKKSGRRMLTFGGDVMMGRRYLDPYWGESTLIRPETRLQDMKSILNGIKPYMEIADFSAINLETILSGEEPAESAPKSVVFYTHPDITEALEWTGIDYVSLGNNHTYDYLDQGLVTTLEALDQSNLAYSGAGMNAEEALASYDGDLSGVPYKAWGYVGWTGRVEPNQVAEENKAGAAYGSDNNIRLSVSSGSRANQIDMVQYHGSREYSEGPSESTETRLKLAVDSGADLVIAHHPHVAQGFEIYKDKLIAYSLGNFAFDQFFYSTHGAIVVHVWMDGDEFHKAEIVPLHVRDYKPLPAMNYARDYVMNRVSRLSAQRGVTISRSGGHGVIGNNAGQGWSETYDDILFVGDFENFDSMGARDRTWFISNGQYEITADAYSGNSGLAVGSEHPETPTRIGLKTYMRVFPSDTMVVKGYIKASPGTQLTGLTQYRPRKKNRYKALEDEPFSPVKTITFTMDGWQPFEFEFKAPGKDRREGRFVFDIENFESVIFDEITVTPK